MGIIPSVRCYEIFISIKLIKAIIFLCSFQICSLTQSVFLTLPNISVINYQGWAVTRYIFSSGSGATF